MCGIAGILGKARKSDEWQPFIDVLQQSLAHRGPDDRGAFCDPDGLGILVHTRLSILDLTSCGHQPMSSPDGRYWIVFNGEIYNYRALKKCLEEEGEAFRSTGDTEIVLRLYMREGAASVARLTGMFAFVIYDAEKKQAFLVRDPLGIKPLYYAVVSGELVFASEIRTLLRTGMITPDWDSGALVDFLVDGHVSEPDTLLKGIRLLPAGSTMLFAQGKATAPRCYWSPHTQPISARIAEPALHVREALDQSVVRHFVSDVPVGVFLSGGIDSTTLLATSTKLFGDGQRTYSISFAEGKWNEGPMAARIARHFKSTHTDFRLDANLGKKLFRDYLARIDQPSIDGFNTYCVSYAARQDGAKVVLSGVGGDELFGGYPSFWKVPLLFNFVRPASLLGGRYLGKLLQSRRIGPRWRRLGALLEQSATLEDVYRTFRAVYTTEEAGNLAGKICAVDVFPTKKPETREGAPRAIIANLELTGYMRNRLLRDSDVMSMAHGLELRVPFVDSQFVEELFKLPSAVRLERGKALLVRSVPEIPSWVAGQRKRAFLFPFHEWMSGDWRNLFEPMRRRFGETVLLDSWSRLYALFILDEWWKQLPRGVKT